MSRLIDVDNDYAYMNVADSIDDAIEIVERGGADEK